MSFLLPVLMIYCNVSRQNVYALLLTLVTLTFVGARATNQSVQSDAAIVVGALSKAGA